ncbi:lipid-A-disaccharide synthase N-terminal domain-containing protein [Camelimonas abortus]|uniref:Lipid-A-disaccharide synthase N-terminal domain-containing protein n=1 Tax=Camelimonas abortus TaxID=1017184 RepID=A0ABV7LD17_9HYPH
MLIQLSHDIGGYLYDVFVARADLWLALGLFGQALFAMRFVVQWLASERAGRSVVPVAFWFFSIGGGVITLVYGLYRREPVIILGQALSVLIYVRNLMLIRRSGQRESESA